MKSMPWWIPIVRDRSATKTMLALSGTIIRPSRPRSAAPSCVLSRARAKKPGRSLRPCLACASRPRSAAMAPAEPLRRELELVSLRQALDVALVEELHAHVGIALAQLPQLAVLPRHERLLHHSDLHIQVLLGQVEVWLEGLDDAAVLVLLEDEGLRLVLPGHTVVVQDLGAFELCLVREAGRFLASICLEIRRFQYHLDSG